MTIEEKVRETLDSISYYNHKAPQYHQATQAILALIKPMSRERLVEVIYNAALTEWSMVGLKLSLKNGFQEEQYKGNIRAFADAILAEWEKGL